MVSAMGPQRSVSERDLLLRSKEIMDAVERGQEFTVTRGGHEIGCLVPVARHSRFVSRREFLTALQHAPTIDLDRFQSDLECAVDDELTDPYAP